MSITITKTAKGLRIVADGYDEGYKEFVQGATVCDVTVTEAAAKSYGVSEKGGDWRALVGALEARQNTSSRERAKYYPQLKGCIVRELRTIR